MYCLVCGGEGKRIVFGCPGFQVKELDCEHCNGTGIQSENAAHWREQAERFLAERRAARMTMRAFCERTGMNAVAVSRMERGIDDPTPIIDALRLLRETH